jgi:hypothetical protein
MMLKSGFRRFVIAFTAVAATVLPAAAAEKANGLYLDPPAGWQRTHENDNVVYRTAECSLSVLPARELGDQKPVPFFLQTWSSVKGALPIISEQPASPMRTADGSFARYASVVVRLDSEERIIAVFMASNERQAHFIVFTGPQPSCDRHRAVVERALQSVSLDPKAPQRL